MKRLYALWRRFIAYANTGMRCPCSPGYICAQHRRCTCGGRR